MENHILIEKLIQELCPLKRSLMGKGVEDSIKIIEEYTDIKFTKYQFKSGTRVNDWDIPQKWELEEAYIKDLEGNIICHSNESILRVVQYSSSIKKKISLKELKRHLYYSDKIHNAYPFISQSNRGQSWHLLGE